MLLPERCPHCNGKGKQITRSCHVCRSEKTIQTQHTLALHIPAGAPEGFEEIFHGEADEQIDMEAGDVVVRVRSKLNEGEGAWRRKENGILGRVTLSVAEVRACLMERERTWLKCWQQALLGFERRLTHLDGRTITLSRTGTTQPGEVEVIEGEGVRILAFQLFCESDAVLLDAIVHGHSARRHVY